MSESAFFGLRHSPPHWLAFHWGSPYFYICGNARSITPKCTDKLKTIRTTLSIFVTGLLASSFVAAAEADVSFNTLPDKVAKEVRRVVGRGQVIRTTKETEKNGRVIYEVSYRVGSKKFEAEISTAGELIVVDEEISLAEAPKPVAKAIREKAADGRIRKIEKATKGSEIFYEVEFVRAGKEHEIKIAPDGNVLEVE